MKLQSKITSSHTQPVLLSPEEVNNHFHRLLILDVQNPKYATCTVPKAKRLNLDIMLKEVPKAQPILLTCLNGQRSFAAAKQLITKGYFCIYVLKGGVMGWQRAGIPCKGLGTLRKPGTS